jgi:hypothetical protein
MAWYARREAVSKGGGAVEGTGQLGYGEGVEFFWVTQTIHGSSRTALIDSPTLGQPPESTTADDQH